MSKFFTDALSAASGEEWEEIPVTIEEFVTSERFLKLPPLSEHQYSIVRAASQIYKRETLISLYGEVEGHKRWKETYNEVVLMLGKGSGKDHCSVIAVCYIVYLLLCLKNPSGYYGMPDDEPIDLINVAINADQARTVFFNRFKTRIENCPWFNEGVNGRRYTAGNNVIDFEKNVHAYSGHSQREAFEGKNLLVAILDEISAFALESNTGNDQADTADATYNMYADSVTSRFAKFGKVVLLSFPRFYGDYIMQRYGPEFNDEENGMIGAVAEKEVILRTHTFKINEDLPDGYEGNEFTIEWEEDHITRYAFDNVFALRRPSWEVNPTKDINDYKKAFLTNKANALGKFACMPSDSTDDTFFKNKEAIETSFSAMNGVDNNGVFNVNFRPKAGVQYYIHVDLSKVHDRCAVSLAHVEKWITHADDKYHDLLPVVKIDAVRWWKPSKTQPMDYREVTNYIMDLKKRGFDIRLVTFDRWQSHDTRNYLEARGMKTDNLSVANQHYDDFLTVMYDDRLVGPRIQELVDELRQLRYIKDKVDHPRTGFKDLSDAVCGSIWNAVQYTMKPSSRDVEVVTLDQIRKRQRAAALAEHEKALARENKGGVIRAPKQMPQNITEDIDNISTEAIRII